MKPLINNKIVDFPKINRVEIIDSTGRVYTNYNASKVQISIQDKEKTMKIFLK